MTSKSKKAQGNKTALRTAKGKKAGLRAGRIGRLLASASVEDELFRMAEENAGSEARVESSAQAKNLAAGPEARWNRPRKQRISLRVDREVVDWFKSKGLGYQTRV